MPLWISDFPSHLMAVWDVYLLSRTCWLYLYFARLWYIEQILQHILGWYFTGRRGDTQKESTYSQAHMLPPGGSSAAIFNDHKW